ncbi:hypothetical protein L3X38_045603 [Prunus dulcis]|uniref:Uncharacterized protein n=1 Tax=Prunus dulcis TaxID=3755 RepID=A0AAD4YJ21_PRUDU|nr:hypothetical protein L3X38_045603 [Prunus dulcis]
MAQPMMPRHRSVKKPFICKELVKADNSKTKFQTASSRAERPKNYTFELTRAEGIFDLLLAEKKVTLSFCHKIPKDQELKGNKLYAKISQSSSREHKRKKGLGLPAWLTTDLQIGRINGHIQFCFRSSGKLLSEYLADDSLLPNSPINLIEFQHELDDDDVLTIDDLDPAPTEMEDSHPET